MKAVVFTHFRRARDEETNQELTLNNRDEKIKQQEKWRDELEPYSKSPSIKLIYIFFTDGYQVLLSHQAIPFKMLNIERDMREVLINAATDVGVEDRIQIIGFDELLYTLSDFQIIAERNKLLLNKLLLGGGRNVTYDSPKMVEAFIRLARGSQKSKTDEIILRFDEDVAVNQAGIDALIDYRENLPADMKSKNDYHFFSGHYQYHEHYGTEDLLNDYAERTTHFAQPKSQTLKPRQKGYRAAQNWLNSLKYIGANPYTQVISGAGLCMSFKSIMTLPPFANAGTPIIWIDDHLKRRLHEALKHLPHENDKSYRHCEKAFFEQDRYPKGVKPKDIDWTADEYLQRLIRGIIMDNLIWDRDKWEKEKNGAGVYTGYVKSVLPVLQGGEGKRVPTLKSLRAALFPEADKAFSKILNSWSSDCYSKYPIYNYVRDELRLQKDRLFKEVFEAFHSYLNLLHQWKNLVPLWQYMNRGDPKNEWLFRNLELD